MIAAVDIFDEVEADVTGLNGEVVRRALHGTCCDFFANREEFRWLLARYAACKQELHRVKISEKIWLRRNHSAENCDLRFYRLGEYLTLAENLRDQLRIIWPCAACIWIYNPTHRLRRFPQLAC